MKHTGKRVLLFVMIVLVIAGGSALSGVYLFGGGDDWQQLSNEAESISKKDSWKMLSRVGSEQLSFRKSLAIKMIGTQVRCMRWRNCRVILGSFQRHRKIF
ncbi:MAG: hypothetical protein K2X29_04360 [Candidatus Obscuribacterales bacterium]|nr:hypothetical protein [Candidatus Obscuribacterales bacterium]